jgi:membrane complex biogenesis BtpA family protein
MTSYAVHSIFGAPRALIGVVHVQALPGTPEGRLSVEEIARTAVEEAQVYQAAGFGGLMIENMHDRPYMKGTVGPEVVAAMATVGREVRRALPLPLGVQVLAGANREALWVAHACGARFVRVEGFVFAHVADEGVMQASAGDLLRYRRAIGAEGICVFADVKKKHSSHAMTADVDLVETAHAAEFFKADGVIVTGTSTGRAADPEEVAAVGRALRIPTLVGSGITPDNLRHYATADAFIVGTAAKRDGNWENPPDPERARALVEAFEKLPAGPEPGGDET